jgi:U3 small nucleolar RNA-associated protein 19
VQFFKLADIFLASGLVPAYTAAAFAKRFARLALRAPPSGAMVALGFVHNLVRRHPSCMVLLHRPQAAAPAPAAAATAPTGNRAAAAGAGKAAAAAAAAAAEAAAAAPGADPYDASEPDPAHSRAVESSLWEVEALRRHYCPQVSTLLQVLDKDLSDRAHTSEVDLDPLLAASYSSLIASEAGRRLKAAPVAFYPRPPAALFGGAAAGAGEARSAEAGARGGNGALLEPIAGWDLEALPAAVAVNGAAP